MKFIKLIILILSVFIFNSNAGLLRKFGLSAREWKKAMQFVLMQRKLKKIKYILVNPDCNESFERKKQILDQMLDNMDDQGVDLLTRLKEEFEKDKKKDDKSHSMGNDKYFMKRIFINNC